jgi:hypothetical protein
VNRGSAVIDSTPHRSPTAWGATGVQTHPGTVYRFGPFEVNAASGELLKNGGADKVAGATLSAPPRAPGEAVSREKLRSRLWYDDIFVDFDGSSRVAVRKLREALDDSAEDPRYIETIPKRGYRFPSVDGLPGSNSQLLGTGQCAYRGAIGSCSGWIVGESKACPRTRSTPHGRANTTATADSEMNQLLPYNPSLGSNAEMLSLFEGP